MKSKLLAVAASVLLASVANAAAVTLIIDMTSCWGAGCTPSAPFPAYGQVVVEQSGTGVDVTASLHPDFAFSGGTGIKLMFNAVGITLADINIGPHPQHFEPIVGPFIVDGGPFDFALTCTDCAAAFATAISFHVNDATVADLAKNNATNGIAYAANVYGWGSNVQIGGSNENHYTPLPAALPLFATGLGALGLLGWRRKKKAA
jgi:hypothetical protein